MAIFKTSSRTSYRTSASSSLGQTRVGFTQVLSPSPRSRRNPGCSPKLSTNSPHTPFIRRLLARRGYTIRRKTDDRLRTSRDMKSAASHRVDPQLGHLSSAIKDSDNSLGISNKQRRTLSTNFRFLGGSASIRSKDSLERSEKIASIIDHIPFAVRSQTLLSLSAAARRDDIRLRNEGFEMHTPILQADVTPSSYTTNASRLLPINILDPPRPSHISMSLSEPSIYSMEPTHIPFGIGDDATNASLVSSVSTSILEVSLYSIGSLYETISTAASRISIDQYSPVEGEDLSGSSFNEESFLRVAVTELDW